MSSVNDTAAPTDQALLAAEAKGDAALVDTTPTAPADVQLDQVDESSDIERPSAHTESDPEPEARPKQGILRKLSSIFAGSNDNNNNDDYSDSDSIYSLPFRPRPAPDLSATQNLTRQRILQSSGLDTTQLQPEAPVAAAAWPHPKNRRAMRGLRTSSESSETGATRARRRGRRRSSAAKNKINFSEQVKEAVYANQWTASSLGLVETWFNKCERAAEDHTAAAVAARKMHVKVAFPSIVLGAAATGLAFFSVGDECDESSRTETTAISISLAVLTSAFSVLGGLSSLFALSERMSLHTTAAANFLSLARKIQLVLFLPMEIRSPCEVVLSDISGEYLSIIQNSPIIFSGC